MSELAILWDWLVRLVTLVVAVYALVTMIRAIWKA